MARRAKTLSATLVADFTSEFDPSERYFAFGVGLAGEIVAASRRSAEPPAFKKGIGVFPKSQLDAPSDYKVVIERRGSPRARIDIRGERTPCSFVQPTADGILLVGARCRWREEGPEQNAVVFDQTGKPLRRFTLGDGINDVRAAPDGTIWVSYFDEGVFGNYGWRGPGPDPIGASGLVEFDASGRRLLEFDANAAGTDTICDAYAVNLTAPDDVWVYFYTEFPIVRLHQGQYRKWTCGHGGARALVVREDRVALLGDYHDRDGLRILGLEPSGKAKTLEIATLTAAGEALRSDAYAIGVGSSLYLVQDRRVYVLDGW